MTADVQLPQMQVFEKLREIPVVGYAVNTSAGVYNRVKLSHGLINWTLNSAEGAFALALFTVAPIANRLQSPIHVIDDTLCKGIEKLQEKVPVVKDEPNQIYESAKTYVVQTRAVTKVHEISSKSYQKANQVLAKTTCGNMALNGLDTTSSYADQYIDYYLPASEGEENEHPHPNSECEDKVLHTVHTVGTISTKVGKRLYRSLSERYSKRRATSPSTSSSSISNSSTESTDDETVDSN